ncbi:MAG TPA: hypothetical protein PLG27_06470, partial [Candidatus Latescibacteria bacterium]|nr:hypothetical protein [Candidatus Latescibacterota bacterium]
NKGPVFSPITGLDVTSAIRHNRTFRKVVLTGLPSTQSGTEHQPVPTLPAPLQKKRANRSFSGTGHASSPV